MHKLIELLKKIFRKIVLATFSEMISIFGIPAGRTIDDIITFRWKNRNKYFFTMIAWAREKNVIVDTGVPPHMPAGRAPSRIGNFDFVIKSSIALENFK